MSRFAPACSRGHHVVKAAWLILAALQFAGCAQTAPVPPTSSSAVAGQAASKAPPSQGGKTVPSSFNDLPIPQGAKLNVDKTLVVGTQTWYGQLMLETSHSADAMYDFYSRELANFGWRRIAAVRAPTSILTYDRENRVLAIAIQPARVYGSEITITVSPREEATPTAGPAIGPGGGEPIGGPIMPPPVRQVR